MEHAALHALQLIGLIAALGGPIFVLALLQPVARALPVEAAFLRRLQACQRRWVVRGAVIAAVAALCDLFVQTAEVEGRTVFGGVAFAQVLRFATLTTVGNLVLLRIGLLIITALLAAKATRATWGLVALSASGALLCTALVSHAAA